MFKNRSYKKELLDEENIPRDLLFQNLRELELVNIWLGGLQITLAGLKTALKRSGKSERAFKVADIGCGGGDALRAMARYTAKNDLQGSFIGIDLKSDCIDYAERTCAAYPSVSFIESDFREAIRKDPSITHVHAALFCHHLDDSELVELFRFCREEKKTLIINDLQRHPLAYYSIWAITRLLRGSKLVKNDAPLSVLRGFKKKELRAYLEEAGIKNYSLRWKWAFRYLIIVPHEGN